MSPLITHLVIGERVFAQLERPTDYGAFLLGCLLVDVNAFTNIDRRQTHFVGRLDEVGQDAFRKSCSTFLEQLDTLLARPWNELTIAEESFVTGYLCHLAADEKWKEFGWQALQKLGLTSIRDFPVPGNVFLTAFSVLSRRKFIDFPAVRAAVQAAAVPNILVHISHKDFVYMRDTFVSTIPPTLPPNGEIPEAYFEMIKHKGEKRIKIERQQHEQYWKQTKALICEWDAVEIHIRDAIKYANGQIGKML